MRLAPILALLAALLAQGCGGSDKPYVLPTDSALRPHSPPEDVGEEEGDDEGLEDDEAAEAEEAGESPGADGAGAAATTPAPSAGAAPAKPGK